MIEDRSGQQDFAHAKGRITVKEKQFIENRRPPAHQSDVHDMDQQE
jgi:hypothetical protein